MKYFKSKKENKAFQLETEFWSLKIKMKMILKEKTPKKMNSIEFTTINWK